MTRSIYLGALSLAVCLSPCGRAADPSTEPRPYHQISREVRELLKQESAATSPAERATAVRRLAALYLEVKRDPRLDHSPTLRQHKARLWSRLTRIRKQLQRDLVGPRTGRRQRQQFEQTSLAAMRISDGLAAQLTLTSYSLGGPARVLAQASAGARGTGSPGGGTGDSAAELVALIHRVIEPDFWDVHGGPGTIFYYAPLHALVVRATSQVHEKIGRTLRGLR